MAESILAATAPHELLRLKSEYLIPCVYHFYRQPPHIVAGEGCRLYDHEGRSYLDCYSGVTVMSAGHGNVDIIEPAIEQMRRLQHTTSIYLTEPVLRLAELLAEVTPGPLKRSFFCASALWFGFLHEGDGHRFAWSSGEPGKDHADEHSDE